jgi:hypothetical protein
MCLLAYTYEDFEDVDLIDEGSVVFDFLLLNCFNRELLVTLPVLRQVNDAEPAICKLGLERVNLFDVALSRVDEVLWLVLRASVSAAGGALTGGASRMHLSLCHNVVLLKSKSFFLINF